MKQKIKLISIKRLKSGNKKYIAEFEITKPNGKKSKKSTKFGAKGMSDYTIHKDTDRRNNYINRHKKDLRTNDPSRAGYLSMYILWNKKTFKSSLLDYKRRLNSYNKTGKFSINISGSVLKSKGKSKGKSQFGGKIRFDDNPSIKVHEVDQIIRKTPKPINRIQKRLYTRFDEKVSLLSQEFSEFIGSLYSKNLIDEEVDYCLVKIFKSFYRSTTLIDLPRLNRSITNHKCIRSNLILSYLYINPEGKRLLNIVNGYINKKKEYEAQRIVTDSENNKFGKINLYPFLVDKTRFRDLPPDIIEKIEQNLQISDIINQYKSYKQRKYIFELITEELGNRQTDSEYEYIYDWDMTDEQSVDWLLEASKLLTKYDLHKQFWIVSLSNFIIGFAEAHNLYAPGQSANYDLSEKYITIILNKIGFEPKINPLTDDVPFYHRQDILEYFNINNNAFGKSTVPNNVKNKKLYLKIKRKIKTEVENKKRRWGAYDSGRLVKQYKQAGGKYKNISKNISKSTKSSNLDRWYREKWIDACVYPKIKSCGRTKNNIKSKVTYCRPSKIIDNNTPTTIQELSKYIIKKRCSEKKKNPKKIIK